MSSHLIYTHNPVSIPETTCDKLIIHHHHPKFCLINIYKTGVGPMMRSLHRSNNHHLSVNDCLYFTHVIQSPTDELTRPYITLVCSRIYGITSCYMFETQDLI